MTAERDGVEVPPGTREVQPRARIPWVVRHIRLVAAMIGAISVAAFLGTWALSGNVFIAIAVFVLLMVVLQFIGIFVRARIQRRQAARARALKR